MSKGRGATFKEVGPQGLVSGGVPWVSIFCDSAKHPELPRWAVRTFLVWPDGSYGNAQYYIEPDGTSHLSQANAPAPVRLAPDPRTPAGWESRTVEVLECSRCGRLGSIEVRSEVLGPVLTSQAGAGVSSLSLSELRAIFTENRDRKASGPR